MEIETKIGYYRVDKKCDHCESGVMHYKEKLTITETRESFYMHVCLNCGIPASLLKKYPYIISKDIGE